jgi:hypothetical protein
MPDANMVEKDEEIAKLRLKVTAVEQLLKVVENAANERAGRLERLLEEPVPGQHEPRNPHADERHRGHDGTHA